MFVRLPEMPNVVVDFHSLPSNTTIIVSLFFALFLILVGHAAYILFCECIIRTKHQLDQKKRGSSLVAQEQGASSSPTSLKALEMSDTSPSDLSLASPSPLLTKCKGTKVERVRLTVSTLEKQQARTPPEASRKGNWGSGMFSWFKWDRTPQTSHRTSQNDIMNERGDKMNVRPGARVSPLSVAAPPRAIQEAPPQAPQLQRTRSWRLINRSGPAFETPLPAMYQTDVPASMAKIIMSRHTYRKPTLRPPPRPSSPVSQVQVSRRPPSIV